MELRENPRHCCTEMKPGEAQRGKPGDETIDGEDEVTLWSWGAGSDGQLATGTLEDQLLPQPLPGIPSAYPVTHMACGGAHAIALTSNRKVFTWGRGTHGQLGQGDLGSCLKPKLVDFLNSFIIHNVSAGWNHSGFVTDTGRLFMCGDGSFGQLGNGDNQSHSLPQEVLFFLSKHVDQVACGMRHSLALVTGLHGSSIYGYGSARHGQIGIKLSQGRRTSIIPKVILGFEDSRIVCVRANGDHSAALSAHGQLYTWGRGFNGKPDCHQPQLLTSSLMFSQVALGWNHALLVSDGQVYMLGRMLTHVQQSTREHQDSNMSFFHESVGSPLLKRITNLIGERVVGIAAGAEHSAVVTDTGTVMTWGWGEHGQLGLGDTDDRISPQRVGLGSKGSGSCPSLRVFCGSGFTFVAKYG